MLKKIEGLEPKFPVSTNTSHQDALSFLPPDYLNRIATAYYGSNRGVVRILLDCADLGETTAEKIQSTLNEEIVRVMGAHAVIRSVNLSKHDLSQIEFMINTEYGLDIR